MIIILPTLKYIPNNICNYFFMISSSSINISISICNMPIEGHLLKSVTCWIFF